MPELTFRDADRSDVGLILEFIKKLADYEKRLDEVIATEEDDNTTQTEETPSVNASSDNATDSQTEANSYSYNAYSAYKKEDYSMDNTFYTRGSY